MMKEYGWPGNIRELQNVVERAVILTETDTFFVDGNWLNAASTESARPQEGLLALADRELEMIEAALAECHGAHLRAFRCGRKARDPTADARIEDQAPRNR